MQLTSKVLTKAMRIPSRWRVSRIGGLTPPSQLMGVGIGIDTGLEAVEEEEGAL